jgi:hypothetical protein
MRVFPNRDLPRRDRSPLTFARARFSVDGFGNDTSDEGISIVRLGNFRSLRIRPHIPLERR